MSVYVGSQINHVLNCLAQGVNEDMTAKGSIDLGMDRLPTLNSDVSDRNRTSPIAFTGNKWEFRGVGAPQALGGPLTVMLPFGARESSASVRRWSRVSSAGRTWPTRRWP